jgi:hypothetical protein
MADKGKPVLVISRSDVADRDRFVNDSNNVTFVDPTAVSNHIDAIKNLLSASFDEVKIIGLSPDEATQAEIFRVLKSKGRLSVSKLSQIGQLTLDLKIQGYVAITEQKSSDGIITIECEKPSWEVGASVGIKVSKPSQESKAAWKMNATDLADDDLIDEDELMDDEIVVKPRGDVNGCGDDGPAEGGKKRACKNCSCGLADEEAKAEQEGQPLPEKKSACGSCYKGDAFRCASCPFLGKPAFEPGQEKLVLALGDDI